MLSCTLQVIQARMSLYVSQILATLAVSLGAFAAGLSKGYTSPALASLQSASNSSSDEGLLGWFSVSQQEGSWIASLSLLGALFGGPLGGWAMRYGRKRTLLAICVPFSISWLVSILFFIYDNELVHTVTGSSFSFKQVTVFAQNVSMMYVAAFACGFCSAIVLLVSNVYISEISSR